VRRVRAALLLLGVLVAIGAAVVYLLPIEDETCGQIFEDLYGSSHDPQLSQTSLWQCLGAIRTVRRRITGELDLEQLRAAEQAAERARQAAEKARDAAQPVRQMPPDVTRTETEAALKAQVRPSLCPELAALTGPLHSLGLLQARGDVILYTLSAECPECRYKQPPSFRWLRPDATIFCEGGGASGGDCKARVAQLQVLFEDHHQGTPAELRAWLGCP
jgi:hypothetical protein